MEGVASTLQDTEGYGCILRVSTDDVAIDDLLSSIKVASYRIDRKGEPIFRSERVRKKSGFHILTHGTSELNLQSQIVETIAFLRTHAKDLASIMSFPGVTGAELDIAIIRRDVVVQGEYLPSELLSLAGNLGIGINISLYPELESGGDPLVKD